MRDVVQISQYPVFRLSFPRYFIDGCLLRPLLRRIQDKEPGDKRRCNRLFELCHGLSKVLRHIGVVGSLTAVACAMFVPLSFRLGEQLKARLASPFDLRIQWAPGSISLITAGLWVFGLAVFIPQIF